MRTNEEAPGLLDTRISLSSRLSPFLPFELMRPFEAIHFVFENNSFATGRTGTQRLVQGDFHPTTPSRIGRYELIREFFELFHVKCK